MRLISHKFAELDNLSADPQARRLHERLNDTEIGRMPVQAGKPEATFELSFPFQHLGGIDRIEYWFTLQHEH
jgi:hypothetical protein